MDKYSIHYYGKGHGSIECAAQRATTMLLVQSLCINLLAQARSIPSTSQNQQYPGLIPAQLQWMHDF